MGHTRALVLLTLVVHSYAAPQFITFKEGKLGVNFGGYHAGVGIGGGAGTGAAAGGLFAEAGTPYGQASRAGLGGAVDGSGKSGGGLFAGATAGGNVRASAGLGGAAGAEHSGGAGFAGASAGAHEAASGLVGDRQQIEQWMLQRREEKRRRKEEKKAQKAAAAAALGGETSGSGSSSFKFSGSKSYGIPTAVVKETEISVVPVENTYGNKVHTELKLNTDNEIQHTDTNSNVDAHVEVKASAPAVVVKEVYVEPQPKIIEKTIVHTHYKPSHHHHKTAYIGGYIGGAANIPPPPPPAQKRIDIGVDSSAHVEGGFGGSDSAVHGNGGQVTYKEEVVFDKNQNFFRDIFNIPISTLQAVGNLLSNTAASTSVKVEKSASVQAGGYGQAGGYHQAGGFGQEGGRVQLEKDVQTSGQVDGYGQGSGYGQAGGYGQGNGFGNFAKSFQFGGYSQFNHGY